MFLYHLGDSKFQGVNNISSGEISGVHKYTCYNGTCVGVNITSLQAFTYVEPQTNFVDKRYVEKDLNIFFYVPTPPTERGKNQLARAINQNQHKTKMRCISSFG